MSVRIGFIGVGGMAEQHIITLQRVEHAKLTAVYDIDSTRAQEIASKYGAQAFSSSEALLDSGEVDAIFICTPPFVRGDIEEAAASRGIHLLSEKPIGLDMDDVRRKEQIIRHSGIIHTSGYCLRYQDIVAKAKAYLADKQIDLVLAYRLGDLPGMRWWRIMEQSGGQLVEQATHQLDLIRYLAGDFKQVHAYHELRSLHKIHPETTAYDVGTVSFVLNSGAVGNITSSSLAKYSGRSGVEFYGQNFFLSIDGMKLRIADDHQDITEVSKVDFYYEQNKTFVEAIRSGNPELLLGNYSDAADTLETTLAANESAVTGLPVLLGTSKESAS